MIRFLKVYDKWTENYKYVNVNQIENFYENYRDKYDSTNKFLTEINLINDDHRILTEYDCETLSRILNEKE